MDLARLLPGEWEVRATSFPMWLTGRKLHPRFVYEVASTDPLVLHDAVNYRTPRGTTKYIVGTDTLVGDTFEWRGRGLLSLFVSRWRIVEQHGPDLLVLEFEKTLATPAGRDVIARAGVARDRVEAVAGGLTVL